MFFKSLCLVLVAGACVQALPTFFTDNQNPQGIPDHFREGYKTFLERLQNIVDAKREFLKEGYNTAVGTGKKVIDAGRNFVHKVRDAAAETAQENVNAFEEGLASSVDAGKGVINAGSKVIDAKISLVTALPNFALKTYNKMGEDIV